jgi:hypothetical protein
MPFAAVDRASLGDRARESHPFRAACWLIQSSPFLLREAGTVLRTKQYSVSIIRFTSVIHLLTFNIEQKM